MHVALGDIRVVIAAGGREDGEVSVLPEKGLAGVCCFRKVMCVFVRCGQIDVYCKRKIRLD